MTPKGWWLTAAQIKVRERWVQNLRSGEYKQARGQLREVDSKGTARFCCLGVLAVQLDPAADSWTDAGGGIDERMARRAGLLERTELSCKLGEDPVSVGLGYGTGSDQSHLIDVNDEYRKDFRFIADLIELDTIARTSTKGSK